MGRTKTRKNLRTLTVKVEQSTPTTSKSPPSAASLLEKAQLLVTQCNYDLAHKFLARVLEQEPSNVYARESLGEVYLELGDLEVAKKVCQVVLIARLIS